MEDLVKSKELAIAGMRQQTMVDTKALAESVYFGDTTTTTEEDIKSLYTSTAELITASQMSMKPR